MLSSTIVAKTGGRVLFPWKQTGVLPKYKFERKINEKSSFPSDFLQLFEAVTKEFSSL